MENRGIETIRESPLSFSNHVKASSPPLFDRPQKDLFLQSLRDNPRNIGKACKRVGITRQTYLNHYTADKEFAKDVLEALECDLDDAEENITAMAKTKSGYLPAITLLRMGRGAIWNPEHRMTVVHETTAAEGARTVEMLQDVVDAEILPAARENPNVIEDKGTQAL